MDMFIIASPAEKQASPTLSVKFSRSYNRAKLLTVLLSPREKANTEMSTVDKRRGLWPDKDQVITYPCPTLKVCEITNTDLHVGFVVSDHGAHRPHEIGVLLLLLH